MRNKAVLYTGSFLLSLVLSCFLVTAITDTNYPVTDFIAIWGTGILIVGFIVTMLYSTVVRFIKKIFKIK